MARMMICVVACLLLLMEAAKHAGKNHESLDTFASAREADWFDPSKHVTSIDNFIETWAGQEAQSIPIKTQDRNIFFSILICRLRCLIHDILVMIYYIVMLCKWHLWRPSRSVCPRRLRCVPSGGTMLHATRVPSQGARHPTGGCR